MALYKILYMAQIARASSHIASTLSENSRYAAIAEAVTEFREHNPEADLSVFLELLADNIRERHGVEIAASVVRFVPR